MTAQRSGSKSILQLLKVAFGAWKEDNVATYAAALAYYAVFSLAPILIIAISVGSLVFGQEAARGQVSSQVANLIGREGAYAIEGIVNNASRQGSGVVAGIVGIVALLLGASGVFGQLKETLNTIWEVAPREKASFWKTVKDRFLSLAMVFGTCFMLVVSLVVSAAIGGVIKSLPVEAGPLLYALDFVLSVGVLTLLFAGLFRFVPDTTVRWKDVWFGAAFTALLMTVGKILIGLYLGRSGVSSSYGAAGAIVLVLLWTNYSSQLLFFGAEITKAHADRSSPNEEGAQGRS